MELDPLDDEDFEELVRDALDDLPDLLRNALAHVAVVISDGGRRQRRLRPLPRRRRDPRHTHDRIVIFRDTLRRDFGHDPELLRDQVDAHRPPRARPPRRVRRARASAASICRSRRGSPLRCAMRRATIAWRVRARAQPVRRGSVDRGASGERQGGATQMPEAVIVDAIRTPIGRAVKGSLKTVRADDLAAIPLKALIERNPQLDPSSIVRHHDGLRLRRGRAGLQRRAHRRPAGGHRPPRARLHGQPLLRLLAADHADGLPRDQGRRGRHLHRRRRGGRLARRRRAPRSSSTTPSTAPRAPPTTSTSRWA